MTGADGGSGQGGSRRDFLRKTAIAAALAGTAALRPLTAAAKAKKAKGEGKGMSILILGGTRFLGPAIVVAAGKNGHTLTLINRRKSHPGLYPDLEYQIGDRDGNL